MADDTYKLVDDSDADKARAEAVALLTESHKRLTEEQRKAVAEQKAALEQAKQLKRLYGDGAKAVDALAQRNKAYAASMRDGSLGRQAREVARLNDEYRRLQRTQELTERYGPRVGGWAARHDGVIQAGRRVGGYVGGAALATGGGLARQGFSGTTEAAVFNNEWKMLSREVAGVAKPVIDVFTRLTRSARKFLEGLDETGQNIALAGLVGGSGYGALRFARAGGVAGIAASALGLGGGAAGGAVTAGGIGSAVGTAAGGGAAGATAARGAGLLGKAGRFARAIPYAGLVFTAADAATSGDYGRMRQAGKSRFGSGAVAVGASLFESYHMLAPWETGENPIIKAREKWDKEHPQENRRRTVTVSGGGTEEVGSGYERINAAISRSEAPRDLTAAIEENTSVLSEFIKVAQAQLEEQRRGNSVPLKRPGT